MSNFLPRKPIVPQKELRTTVTSINGIKNRVYGPEKVFTPVIKQNAVPVKLGSVIKEQ